MAAAHILSALIVLLASPVTLMPGQPGKLLVTVTTGPGGTAAPDEAVTAKVVLSARDHDGALLQEEAPLKIPGSVSIELRTDLVWSVDLDAQRYWAPTRSVLVGDSQSLTISAVPTGVVRAQLTQRPNEEPGAITVWCWTSGGEPGRQAPPLVSGDRCEREGTAVTCRVPSGQLDLRLGSAGFVPLYFWESKVPPHGSVELGALRLERGSSVSGWCEGRPVQARARVTVTPVRPGKAHEFREHEQSIRDTLTVPVSDRGFFQAVGLPAGEYMIEATAAALRSRRVRVQVAAASESQLPDPLRLVGPAALTVSIAPPVDPAGQPWLVQLIAMSDGAGQGPGERAGHASSAGEWNASNLSSGRYLIGVEDSLGNRLAARTISIEGDRTEAFLLSAVEVDGTLRCAGEPCGGAVAFSEDVSARQVTMEAGPDGSFSGVLPEEGKWLVEVVRQSGRTIAGAFDVRLAAGESRARVTIDVGGGSLQGNVVDTSGQPIAGASVAIVIKGGPLVARAQSLDNGAFEVHDLLAGDYLASAQSAAGTSGAVATRVTEEPGGPLRLVIRPRTKARGVVTGPWGPVIGAAIIGLPRSPQGVGPLRTIRTHTAGDGTFEVEVPAGCTAADILIAPPGLGARLVVLPVSDEVVALEVSPNKGTLRVKGRASWKFLVSGAASVPANLVLGGPRGIGDAQSAASPQLSLEPGRYGICTAPGGGGRCTWGVVSVNGEELLDADEVDPQAAAVKGGR